MTTETTIMDLCVSYATAFARVSLLDHGVVLAGVTLGHAEEQLTEARRALGDALARPEQRDTAGTPAQKPMTPVAVTVGPMEATKTPTKPATPYIVTSYGDVLSSHQTFVSAMLAMLGYTERGKKGIGFYNADRADVDDDGLTEGEHEVLCLVGLE